MARQLKEIKNFNSGLITNADSRDIPDDSASLARNIDPNAPGGTLVGFRQDRWKGDSTNYALYQIPTGTSLTAAATNQSSYFEVGSIKGFYINQYIAVGAYAYSVAKVHKATKRVYVNQLYGVFTGGSVALAVKTAVYYIPLPTYILPYMKDAGAVSSVENLIIFDEQGTINGVQQFNTEVSGTIGAGINITTKGDNDFTNFPYKMNHAGKVHISPGANGKSYYIAAGKTYKSKWLGKIPKASLLHSPGWVLEDSEVYSPDVGSATNSYDKIITYQFPTATGGSDIVMPRLKSETGAIHVGFIKGHSYLYVIDGDSGKTHKTMQFPFRIYGIAKVVSCKTDLRVWVYSRSASNWGSGYAVVPEIELNVKPGNISCFEIFDLNGSTDIIDLNQDDIYPQGVPVNLCQTIECEWGIDKDSGYPSAPYYDFNTEGAGDGFTGDPIISDILETVDASGNGKLWLLSSCDTSKYNQSELEHKYKWFRTSQFLEGSDATNESAGQSQFKLHRHLWCSFSNIDGDTADVSTSTVYFNCKSMTLPSVTDKGVRRESGSIQSNQIGFYLHNRDVDGASDESETDMYFKLMKRSVPEASTTTYTQSAGPLLDDLKDYTKSYQIDGQTVGTRKNWVATHGGSYWYLDAQDFQTESGIDTANDRVTLKQIYDITDVEITKGAQSDGEISSGMFTSKLFISSTAANTNSRLKLKADTAYFNPLPYSLVDLSDLYDGVDHVVGCLIKVSDQSNPVFLEDMWFSHIQNSSVQEFTKGIRATGMKGKTILWIANGGRNNYGALYTRQNSFGYDTDNNTSETSFDDLNLSTLCYDNSDDVVRVMKVLGTDIPDSGILSIARNKTTHEYSGSNTYNDSGMQASGLFVTYKPNSDTYNNLSAIGLSIRLNTTLEQGDTIPTSITDAAGNTKEMITTGRDGLAGYARNTASVSDDAVHDNPGADDNVQVSPINTLALSETAAVSTFGESNLLQILSLEDKYATNNNGLDGGDAVVDTDVAFPNGPGVLSGFVNDTLIKLYYSDLVSMGGTNDRYLLNVYKENFTESTEIPDATPLFLRSENMQNQAYPIRAINQEGQNQLLDTESFKSGLFTRVHRIFTPNIKNISNLNFNEAKDLIIGNVWGRGKPNNSSGAGAELGRNLSKHFYSNYYFSLFNKGGTENIYYSSLQDFTLITSASDASVNELTLTDTQVPGFRFKLEQNSEYKKEVVLEFETGDDAGGDEGGISWGFMQGVPRNFKINYEYDGYQNSPISDSVYQYINTTGTASNKVHITVKIPQDINRRISAVNIWMQGNNRLDNNLFEMEYTHIYHLELQNFKGWVEEKINGDTYFVNKLTWGENNIAQGQTFKDYAGFEESYRSTNLDYEISTVANGYLFAANCKGPFIDEGDNVLVRSLQGQYSIFDSNPFKGSTLSFGDSIRALAYFQGSLYVFLLNEIHRINPGLMAREDVLEGFGCSNKDAVVVTEYGMFFADQNHVYHHDGQTVKIISYAVENDVNNSLGYRNIVYNNNLFKMYFFPKYSCIAIVSGASTTDVLTYHILKKRWDSRKLQIADADGDQISQLLQNNIMFNSKSTEEVFYFVNPAGKGDFATTQSSKVAQMSSDSEQYAAYRWHSKDFTMGQDNVDKRFLKLKIQASGTLPDTPVVKIDGLVATLVSTGTNEWKINANASTGAVVKGKKIKVEMGTSAQGGEHNQNTIIYSIGIIYRTLKIK
tara:strand:- start:17705 stop:22834 length:5130 start_codon:yes stop_codon:yes gene_type:complete